MSAGDKHLPPRRSAGMHRAPTNDRPKPVCAPVMPARSQAATPISTSRAAKPKVLMGETEIPRGPEISRRREAFRTFMKNNRLRPTQWAKQADVPAGEILAYLTGKTRNLAPAIAAALAKAARVAPGRMFE